MSATDRILDVIDAGLQSTDEASYGTDLAPDRCARCQHHEPGVGDLCSGCRAFLLEDSNHDPAAPVSPSLALLARAAEWYQAAEDHADQTLDAAIRGRQATATWIDEPYWAAATLPPPAAPCEGYTSLTDALGGYTCSRVVGSTVEVHTHTDTRRYVMRRWVEANVRSWVEERTRQPVTSVNVY